MTKLHPGLPELPTRIAALPRDHRGFPVPWFVQWFKEGKAGEPGEGEPDFRVIDERKLVRAMRHSRCWVCGETTGVHKAFVIGPMCAINRTISEPPSHRECAVFSATACPFLSKPRMKRNERGLAERGGRPAPGLGIKRNPGATCVWVTRSFKPFRVGGGVLFSLGAPEEVLWFCEGRRATRAEVLASVESGLPTLTETANLEGPEAVKALDEYIERARPLWPAQ